MRKEVANEGGGLLKTSTDGGDELMDPRWRGWSAKRKPETDTKEITY